MSTNRRSKKDIERFVDQIKEDEKCSRGHQIAVFYFDIGEYELAKRYLTGYLSMRDTPQAHKLMGQICEALKETEQAIECFKRSLELDGKQKNLTLKICELLLSMPSQDQNIQRLKYWAGKTENQFPNNPIIFRLQEKILMTGEGGGIDKMEGLYAKQLEKNYLDMNLHMKLLELYVQADRVKDAVNHAMEVERTLAFVNSIEWYKCLSRIFKLYRSKEQGSEDFQVHRLFALRNLVYLQIPNSDIITSALSLYQYDQCLWEIVQMSSQKPRWRTVVMEMEGQLYFLLALLLLKRAQKGQISWKDASSFGTVCLLLSNHYSSIDSKSPWFQQINQPHMKFYNRLLLIGRYRLSQGGYMLTALMKSDGASRLQHVRQQIRTPLARDKLYDVVFTLREMRDSKDRSYLMKSDLFMKATLLPPSKVAISEFDNDVYTLYGSNLHELVWIALQKYSCRDKIQPTYGFSFGDKLPYSCKNVTNGAPESLSQLDVMAFFYAVVRCMAITCEENNRSSRADPFKPALLPACICTPLCTKEQGDWWDAMYKFSVSGIKDNYSKMRLAIQRGLESVRLVGAHGMSVRIITHLANTFDARAAEVEEDEDISEELARRAAHYWREASQMLARIEKNMPIRYPNERLFNDSNQSDFKNSEIKELMEQATFSLAVTAMNEGNYEEAKEKFEASKKPMASYYLAKIFQTLAEDISLDDPDAVSKRTDLLERALDTLYSTLDKIQDDKKNDLHRLVPLTVDDVVNQLERLRTAGISMVDSINIGELEEDDLETTPSFSTPQGQANRGVHDTSDGVTRGATFEPTALFGASPREVPSFTLGRITEQSTPAVRRISSEHNTYRPSPERLDARIWALEKKLQTVLDLHQGSRDQNQDLISSLRQQMDRNTQTLADLQMAVREQTLSKIEQKDMVERSHELKQAVRDLQEQFVEVVKEMKELRECVLSLRGANTAGRYMVSPVPTPFRPPQYGYTPQQQSWIPPSNYGYPVSSVVPPIPAATGAYPGAMGSYPRMTPHSQQMEQLSHQNDIVEDDIYHIDGEYYEDDGSQPPPPTTYSDTQLQQDWPFGHRAGLEGKSTITYSPQNTAPQAPQAPQALQSGFFAQALRGQALQYAYKQGASQGIMPRGQSPQMVPQQQGLPGPGFFSSFHQNFPAADNGQNVSQAALFVGGSPSLPQGSALMEALTKSSTVTGSVTMTTVTMPPNAVAGPSMQSRPNLVQGVSKGGQSEVPTFMTQTISSQPYGSAATTLTSGSNVPLFGSLVAAAKSPDKSNTDTEINVTIHPATTGPNTSNSGNIGGLSFTIDSVKVKPKSGSAPSFADLAESASKSNTFVTKIGSPKKSPLKGDDDHVEEYEPQVDFKPVVDLPDLIEVKTGEEEEEKLFGERAKLFRYDSDTKQWKDRGVGEMKLLKHKVTHRVRVLMRREQVFKLCANHFLAPEMKLSPMSGSDRAWCWSANDYSEEELKVERLAVKFKSADTAAQFRDIFDKCVAELEEEVRAGAKPSTEEPKKDPLSASGSGFGVQAGNKVPAIQKQSDKKEPSGFGEKFKPKKGEWNCDICYVKNPADKLKCLACATQKPGSKPEQAAPSGGGFKFGTTGTSPQAGGFKFGTSGTTSQAGGFKFGVQDDKKDPEPKKEVAASQSVAGAIQKDEKPAAAPSVTGGGFKFGGSGSSGFKFEAPSTAAKTTDSTQSGPGFKFTSSSFKFGTQGDENKGGFVFNKPIGAATTDSKSTPVTMTTPTSSSTASSGLTAPSGSGATFGTSTGSIFKTATDTTKKDSAEQKSDSKPVTFKFSLTPDPKKEEQPVATSGFKFTFDKNPAAVSGDSKVSATNSSPVTFAPPTSVTPQASKQAVPKSPEIDADGMYLNKEGEDDHIHFEPVVEMPDKIEVVTGEEDDDIMFENRAKLYRFHDKQWKERGLGVIKVLCNKETGKCRVLMRRDQILKICCHHNITPDLKLSEMPNTKGKAWVWYAMDFSEGSDPAYEQFSVRFKTPEVASKFKEAFDKARDTPLSPTKKESAESVEKVTTKRSDSEVSNSSTTLAELLLSGDDVVFVKEEKASDEQIEKARRYHLPDNFYLYLSRPPCPGCRGCENVPKSPSPQKEPGKSPLSSKAKPSAEPTSLFGSGASSVVKPIGGVFGGTDSEKADLSKGLLGASAPTKPVSVFGSSDSANAGAGIVFGNLAASGFSFSSLAAETSNSANAFTKDPNKPFAWSGAGKQLFGGGGGGGGDNEDGDENDECVQSNDPHFEPVIPLPDLVEVVTGEEGMTNLFSIRAKLYRFDVDTKQWKEKGVGEMKVLKDPETNKVRLLLRREQILKLACNHWLTPDIVFKPMSTSETAWCWSSQDFSESDTDPKVEQFAVKFKNKNLADDFKNVIDTCQAELAELERLDDSQDKLPVQVSEVSSNAEAAGSGDASSLQKDSKTMQEDDDEEDDYEDDNDEEEVLFQKRLTLYVKENDKWKSLGMGDLKVIYDDDVNGNKVTMETDEGKVVCNHIITKEAALAMNKQKKYCEWSALDFSTDEAVRREFRAQFSSEVAVEEFNKHFEQGKLLAHDSDISERNMMTYPREIQVPEVHSHNAAED